MSKTKNTSVLGKDFDRQMRAKMRVFFGEELRQGMKNMTPEQLSEFTQRTGLSLDKNGRLKSQKIVK